MKASDFSGWSDTGINRLRSALNTARARRGDAQSETQLSDSIERAKAKLRFAQDVVRGVVDGETAAQTAARTGATRGAVLRTRRWLELPRGAR